MDKEEYLHALRHSASHVMAQAVLRIFPEAKLGIGPATEDGFYYDFDLDRPLTQDDLPRIEAEMKKIIEEDSPFIRSEVPASEAIKLFEDLDQPYKVELIKDIGQERVSLYRHSDFVDLCAGPHVGSTGEVKAFKLLSIAGAYWRGSSANKMLQRIYGTAFSDERELDEFLRVREEAEKRDHRKIGRDLDLFSFHEEAPGFPFFHPNGMILINQVLSFWKEEHEKAGYLEVKTPMLLDRRLWEISGHWDHYRENMYFTRVDSEEFAIKPMNCPGGILIYKTKQRSYRDMPLRVAELGLVHRHELSGVLHGLFRVRSFTQDDAHIYCTPEQAQDEIVSVVELISKIYKVFGFEEYVVELSTRPESSIGSDEMWEKAESDLRAALGRKDMDYKINKGAGAFYGPKIDFHIKDCMNRTWQCGTIQLDFAMPERFDLEYTGKDNLKHRPAMIHRTVLGSIERFIGILVEHYAGAFPAWLAPVQAKVLSVSAEVAAYASQVKQVLEDRGLRVKLDIREESINKKIRDAQLEKVPYMIVVGQKERESGNISVRKRSGDDLRGVSLDRFIEVVCREVETRALKSLL